mmetsp:Transcript_22133/g.50869  ORF Transcript_22133/g.50869 Transcript_22133/m.50869 type:complete len:238 (-) Transcript_22133:832-1545(-)
MTRSRFSAASTANGDGRTPCMHASSGRLSAPRRRASSRTLVWSAWPPSWHSRATRNRVGHASKTSTCENCSSILKCSDAAVSALCSRQRACTTCVGMRSRWFRLATRVSASRLRRRWSWMQCPAIPTSSNATPRGWCRPTAAGRSSSPAATMTPRPHQSTATAAQPYPATAFSCCSSSCAGCQRCTRACPPRAHRRAALLLTSDGGGWRGLRRRCGRSTLLGSFTTTSSHSTSSAAP